MRPERRGPRMGGGRPFGARARLALRPWEMSERAGGPASAGGRRRSAGRAGPGARGGVYSAPMIASRIRPSLVAFLAIVACKQEPPPQPPPQPVAEAPKPEPEPVTAFLGS